jgi:poly(A) polymerase
MLNMAAGLARLGDLAQHPVVATLAKAFADAGRDLAVVGGPVRDALLGRATHDLDFTTDAQPDEILAIVTPVSSTQWDIGRAFGTIGARVQGEQVEITTYRADSYDGVTRKPVVAFGDSLEGDLIRRDFTPVFCGPRSTRRSASATTRCGCCARRASRRSWASTSTRAPGARSRSCAARSRSSARSACSPRSCA